MEEIVEVPSGQCEPPKRVLQGYTRVDEYITMEWTAAWPYGTDIHDPSLAHRLDHHVTSIRRVRVTLDKNHQETLREQI